MRRGLLALVLVAFYVMIAIGSAQESRKPFADVRAHQHMCKYMRACPRMPYGTVVLS